LSTSEDLPAPGEPVTPIIKRVSRFWKNRFHQFGGIISAVLYFCYRSRHAARVAAKDFARLNFAQAT
jgi:hypothetical protein